MVQDKQKLGKQILEIFREIVSKDVRAEAVTLKSDFKSDLGIDSIKLFNLVFLVEQRLMVDLFSEVHVLAEARRIEEIVDIAYDAKKSSETHDE